MLWCICCRKQLCGFSYTCRRMYPCSHRHVEDCLTSNMRANAHELWNGQGCRRDHRTRRALTQGDGSSLSCLTLPPPLASSCLGRRQLLHLPHGDNSSTSFCSSITLPPPLASSGLGRRQLPQLPHSAFTTCQQRLGRRKLLQLPHPVFQVLDLALRHDHERLLLAVL